jgi:hypothetical protein
MKEMNFTGNDENFTLALDEAIQGTAEILCDAGFPLNQEGQFFDALVFLGLIDSSPKEATNKGAA